MAGKSERKVLQDEAQVPPMHCPSVQVMEKDEEYDPQRIPTSVFARSDTLTPAEWSVVSNESLFSLHCGHTSMSREHDMLWNNEEVRRRTELSKSGELSPEALRELRKLVGISKSSEFFKSNSPSPNKPKVEEESPTKPKVEEEGEVQVLTNLEEKEVATNGMEKQTPKTMVLEKDEEKGHLQSSSTTSRKSDGSVRSNMSFAFPVLANGGNVVSKGRKHQQHSQQLEETPRSSAPPTPAPISSGFFSWLSCFSCSSCFSCGTGFSCCSCFSFTSCCASCFSTS